MVQHWRAVSRLAQENEEVETTGDIVPNFIFEQVTIKVSFKVGAG